MPYYAFGTDLSECSQENIKNGLDYGVDDGSTEGSIWEIAGKGSPGSIQGVTIAVT
jgi:hypothetical protein